VLIINNSWDKEYSVQWMKEKNHLDSVGIKYAFVKTINGVTTYKYTKNFELFSALKDFYENVYSK